MRRLAIAVALNVLLLVGPSAAQELIMFEEAGCPWCARWDAEVGPIYPKTDEGRRAPLRRVNLHGEWPPDLRSIKTVTFTPTFVLIHDGAEIGRIEGYPGEDFFWGLLGNLIDNLPPREGS